MQQKVSDYIADFLVNNGVVDVFTVTGGGAMHLNDSLGHKDGMHCIYNHHEQASAMAAEAYARIHNKVALVCVTSGPGATNAITGVVCGWMDSIPMLIISGQVRYATTVYASNLNLRTRGVQEFNIIGCAEHMTKYCELVSSPQRIRYCLEKALYMCKTGRPGPCWLDIPLDVQAAIIDPEKLEAFIPPRQGKENNKEMARTIIDKINEAKRPALFVGNGVRLAGAHEEFLELINKLNIPVVTGMSSVDAIPSDHALYIGRSGTTGDRPGNFVIQNCDLLLTLGSRLNYYQTGFNYQSWAPHAYKIVNDIDASELEKDNINADMKVCCDVKILISELLNCINNQLPEKEQWTKVCRQWKMEYPIVQKKHIDDKYPNIYVFYDTLTRKMEEGSILVASCGTSRVAGSQAAVIKKGMRFITNSSTASMGYDLPAAEGACIASGRKQVVLVTGDGSIQMNIQELQTIVHNKLPIVIFVMNNQGYHSIRMTQANFFHSDFVGIGPQSGDLSFPDLSGIAAAYGLQFLRCETSENVKATIEWALNQKEPTICEILLSTEQVTEPKVSSKKLPDGQMLSGTLHDMAPFLPEAELNKIMSISQEE